MTEKTEVSPAAPTPEQLADMAALSAAAGEEVSIDAGEPVPSPEVEAEAWAALPSLFGSLVAVAIPEISGVYTREACLTWGRAMVPVAQKYGWSADSLMGPEIGLALATAPLVVGTVRLVSAARAKAKAAEKAEAQREGAGTLSGPQPGATDANQ